MSRTLVDLKSDTMFAGDRSESWIKGFNKSLYMVQEIIDERIGVLEKNIHNKFTKHKNDSDIEKEIKKMIDGIIKCKSYVDASKIIPELIEFGRKEELIRLKR